MDVVFPVNNKKSAILQKRMIKIHLDAYNL